MHIDGISYYDGAIDVNLFLCPNVKLSHPERVSELLVVINCNLVARQPRERSG